jgi:hypothetical protein
MNDIQFKLEAEDILQKYFKGNKLELQFVLNYLSFDKKIDSAFLDRETQIEKERNKIKDMETDLKKDKKHFEPIRNIPLSDKQRIENLAKYLTNQDKPYTTIINE